MIKRTLGGLGLVMALLGATLIFASPAYAWSTTLTGSAVCNQRTGTFDITWHIVNNEADNVMTVATASGVGLPPNLIGAHVPAGGSIDRTLLDQSPGSYPLTIGVTWAGSNERASASKTVSAFGECTAPTTSTSTSTSTTSTSTTSTSTTSTSTTSTSTTSTTLVTAATVGTTSTTAGVAGTSVGAGGTSTGPTVLGLVATRQPVTKALATGRTATPSVLAATGAHRAVPFATIGLMLVALGVSILAIAARHRQAFAEVSARLRSLL